MLKDRNCQKPGNEPFYYIAWERRGREYSACYLVYSHLCIIERLLLHDKLTLSDAAQQVESPGEHVKAIMNTETFSVHTVHVQNHKIVHGRSAGGSKHIAAFAADQCPLSWTDYIMLEL